MKWLKRSLQWLFVLLVFGGLFACVLSVPPYVERWPCAEDDDCLYGLKCCPAAGSASGNICLKNCVACNAGQTADCYEMDVKLLGVGECKAGKKVCASDGSWSEVCQKAVYPSEEVCDGKDNDCDGEVDEGLTKCTCVPDSERECYTGDPKFAGVGECNKGKQKCEGGEKWGACTGEGKPDTEICDGKDNDCDGSVDEDLTKECSGSCGKGEIRCEEGKFTKCSGDPQEEVCDGKDNDCDGKIDNKPGTTVELREECPYSGPPASLGKGDCKAGFKVCKDGKLGECEGEITPGPKDCSNNKDNDCDGQIDAGCSCPDSCVNDDDCGGSGCGSRNRCISSSCTAIECPNKCSSDADCINAPCGTRKKCLSNQCVAPSCPSSCTKDEECSVVCGTRRACRAGRCAEPVSCPSSCKVDTDCPSICGTRRACRSGTCQVPTCPSSCTVNQDCATNCGSKTACVNNRCSEPGCPSSCTTSSQCPASACNTATLCFQNKCTRSCPGTCSSDSDCNTPACAKRLFCVLKQCREPNCPTMCFTDADCQVLCGFRKKCHKRVGQANAQCIDPSVCPASCGGDSDCSLDGCGTQNKCLNQKCIDPNVCPTSCIIQSQCTVPGCGTKTQCKNNVCAEP